MSLKSLGLRGQLRTHRLALGGSLMGGIAGIALDLARPWPLKVIVDYALAGHPMPSALAQLFREGGAVSPRRIIILSAAAAAGTVILSAALTHVTRLAVFAAAQRMVVDLAHLVFDKLQRQSLEFHRRHKVGDLVQRAGGDVFAIHTLINAVAFPGILAVTSIAGMVFLMSRVDAVLTTLTASVIPLLVMLALLFNGPLMRAFDRQWRQQGSLMGYLQQSLGGIRAVQVDTRESYVLERFMEHGAQLGDAYRYSLIVGSRYTQASVVITGIVAALLMGYGAARVHSGTLTLGSLLVFLGYLAMVNGPITTLTSAVTSWTEAKARAARLEEILEGEHEVPERADAIRPLSVDGTVTFSHVSFGYGPTRSEPDGRLILDDISFEAHRGQVTAVIGLTGAGKSSLVALLSRFHDPASGSIALDGVDLRDLQLEFLRQSVSVVLQDPILFPMTVADNIGFGRSDATRAEIEAASRLAQADDFIRRLPHSYDTVLSEGGAPLSGGERQRISLARALVKNSPILVLDEPTSSLDAHTEAEIWEGLMEYAAERTTFIISHRLTTIRNADQIVALEQGRVREHGRHEDLLRLGGIYARLYRAQTLSAV